MALLAAASALWLGILTSVSPCPLATNIAAISFIARRISSPGAVFLAGSVYTLGRTVAYLVLGMLIVVGILSIPGLSNFLGVYVNKLLGPILVVVGMVLLELIKFNIAGSIEGERVQMLAEKGGVWGAGLLGIVFALAFCPVSAALFFGSLIPMAVKHNSRFLFPLLYGIGTGLPVLIFAVLIAMGARHVGTAFDRLKQFEWWARRITGAVFILVGIYHSLTYIFGIQLIPGTA